MNEVGDSKSAARKWNIANDQTDANYDVRNKTVYDTKFLKSTIYNISDAFIIAQLQ